MHDINCVHTNVPFVLFKGTRSVQPILSIFSSVVIFFEGIVTTAMSSAITAERSAHWHPLAVLLSKIKHI